jgi:hypothetical protein
VWGKRLIHRRARKQSPPDITVGHQPHDPAIRFDRQGYPALTDINGRHRVTQGARRID